MARTQPRIEDIDLDRQSIRNKPHIFGEEYKNRAVIMDYGVKNNSINELLKGKLA